MPLLDSKGHPILGTSEEMTKRMFQLVAKTLTNFGETPYLLKDIEANQRVRDLYASCGVEQPQAQKFMKFRRYDPVKK